jgi:hypothetical protein
MNAKALVSFMIKHRKSALILFGNIIAFLIVWNEVKAQSPEGYIYGKVTTYDNEYLGQIRWGKEEAFWNDYFNASKINQKRYQHLVEQGKESDEFNWDDLSWALSSIWEDKVGYTTHQFSCQFGDIKQITDIGKSTFTLVLKNDERLRLDGDYANDFGSTIIMYDEELGDVSLRWNRIKEIEFLPTPRSLEVSGGAPIYGTIETYRKGTYTGFIQWDHDERLGQDKLDGDEHSRDISIPFDEVKIIERQSNGSYVETFGGKGYNLTNSNDIDDDNRGIIVSVPEVGKIDIPWKYFRVAKLEKPPHSGPSYNSYDQPKPISGTVYTYENDQFSGQIVYDVDETWDIETLDANDDGVKYLIAFRNVKAIIPKNDDYSIVELRNGEKLLLGDSRDVNRSNDGMVVLTDNKEATYIPWKKIAEIVLD